jgi:hypothetical protein
MPICLPRASLFREFDATTLGSCCQRRSFEEKRRKRTAGHFE